LASIDDTPALESGDIRITWVGHSTVLLELEGVRLLTDPVLGRRVGLLRRVAAPAPRAVADRVDAVLLSHLHTDHTDLPSLRRVGAGCPVLAPPAVARWLRDRGFTRARGMNVGDVTRVGDATVEATPARHDGRRWPWGATAAAIGFLAGRAYFAGDTDLFPEMASLAGRVDVALLPVAGWGPTLGPGHLDPERAAQAAATLRAPVAIPIHWGTLTPPWARTAPDRLGAPARAFAAAARRLAPDVEVRVLEPGSVEVVHAPRARACAPRRVSPPPDR
jgi:L-ascorbate metabolism protein UlaG (beta-lactamase superfamily)